MKTKHRKPIKSALKDDLSQKLTALSIARVPEDRPIKGMHVINLWTDELLDLVLAICALITDYEDKLEKLIARIAELENENAKMRSILNNSSKNCGATTAVDRSSATTYRNDHDENDEEEAGSAPGNDTGTKAAETQTTGITEKENGKAAGGDAAESTDGNGKKEGETKEKAPNEYNGREAQKKADEKNGRPRRKHGGQPGHPGSTLTVEYAQEVMAKMEAQGLKVDYLDFGGDSSDVKLRYRIGWKKIPTMTVYRYHADEKGDFHIPAEMNTVVAYDNTLIRDIVYLRTVAHVSYDNIAGYITNSTDGLITPTKSSICNAQSFFARRSRKSLDWIENFLKRRNVLYTDATYTFKDGHPSYVRNISSKEAVLYIPMDSKSFEALQKIKILPEYEGILVHDHEVVMYHFAKDHGECIVHVIRYCRKDIEDSGNTWAEDLIAFFSDLNNLKKERMKQGIDHLTKEELDRISKRYDEIVALGEKQNKTTVHEFARKKEKSFLKRLRKYKHNHLLFVEDFDVDWSDNRSERDLRKVKRHTVVTGGFRSDSGMEAYCENLSVIETLKKQGITNVWDAILWILDTGENVFEAPVFRRAV